MRTALAMHRLPLPRSEPPYDDETAASRRGVPGAAIQGTLALSFLLPSGLPAKPEAPDLRLVRASADAPRSLPEPTRWAARFVQALVEVLTGQRPVTQLVRWTDAAVLNDLQRRVDQLPPRTGGVGSARAGRCRAQVRSIHVKQPVDRVAEICAVILRESRVSAMAIRLEGRDGHWQCTALEVG